MLYNQEGKMYFQHRTAYKERWAEYWGTFGGGIDGDEAVSEALRREITEELGYRVASPEMLFVQTMPSGSRKYVFIEAYDETQTLTPNEEECQNADWFTLEEVLALKLIPHDREVAKRVAEHLIEKGIIAA